MPEENPTENPTELPEETQEFPEENQNQDPLVPQEKLLIFKMTNQEEGIRVDFDVVDTEGNVLPEEASIADLGMLAITMTKFLKQKGFSKEELQTFLMNVVEQAEEAVLLDTEANVT